MLHLSEKVKITVFLVSAVILGSAATKHPNQRVTFVPKNVKRESPVGNHFGGNLHGGFGQQHGHQQFQLQALSSHQGLDGHQGSHFVMPHFSFAAPQLHSSGHQNLAHGGGAGQFSQLAKILTTQGQSHGGHGGGGFGGAGFGHSFAVGGLKTAPMTFAAAPSTSYGTPASGHFAQLGGAHSAGLAGHGFGGSLQGLNLGSSLGHSLGNLGGGHGVAFKGGDFGAGALSGGNYLLGQNYAPSFNAHQLTALPQASSAQTVPAYAVGIKGLGHYSSGGLSQSHGDLGSQASLGHGLTFDASKYNIQTLSHGKTLAPVAYASPAASNVRHTSISNLDTKNAFKPSVLLGMYADVGNSGDSHGFGGQSLGGQSFSNLKFSQASLPAFSGHGGQSFDSGASYGAGYNTINYSEGAGH